MNGIFNDFKSTWNRPNNGLIQLILINVTVFFAVLLTKVIMTFAGFREIYLEMMSYLMIPADIHQFLYKPWTLFTYFFLHEAPFHLLFNMLFLYWFGNIIMEFKGPGKVITLYILGGVAGGLFYLLLYNTLPYFAGDVAGSKMLGASAGVYAIVVGAAALVPNYRVNLLFFGSVAIKYIAAVYVVFSLANSTGGNAGGNIAHLAGAAIGFLYMSNINRHNIDFGNWFSGIGRKFSNLFKRPSKIKVTHKAEYKTNYRYNAKASGNIEVDQAVIDSILDKISESGYESLTKEEKEKLFNASKK